MTRVRPSKVTAAVCPRYLSSFPVPIPRPLSPSPYLLLFPFTKKFFLTLPIDCNMSHLNQLSNLILEHCYQQISFLTKTERPTDARTEAKILGAHA